MARQEERSRLQELREERGWTQQDVADQIGRLAWLEHKKHVGINAQMVSKYERGEKRPNRMYQELFCLLYGVSVDQLGLGITAKRPPAQSASDASLLATLGGAASVLDQLGEAGAILQPKMFETWKDELMQRRALLKVIGMTPAMTMSMAAEDSRRTRAGKPHPRSSATWTTSPTSTNSSTTPRRPPR